MPVSIYHCYSVVLGRLETHPGPFPVSPVVYHNLSAEIRNIINNVFINPVPDNVIMFVDKMITRTLTIRFMRFLDHVQNGIMNARPCDIRVTLVEWLDQDVLRVENTERSRTLWVCREFLRTHQPSTEDEMETINANAAQVYGYILANI